MKGSGSGSQRGALNGSFIDSVSRLLLLPSCVVGVAVWLKGYVEAGDAFGAGVLAALAVLLQYVASGREHARRLPLVRHAPALAGVGLLLLLGVAFVPLLGAHAPVTHFPVANARVVHLGTLELHTAVVFDGGIFLVVMGFIVTAIDGLLAQRPSEDASAKGAQRGMEPPDGIG
jgi:multicomponent Na+:H+ antiporter subunit B